jgi:hypothetical protein
MSRASLLQTKKVREPYRDPIFGIPHYHDPALNRLIEKHNPSSFLDEGIRILDRASMQHLNAVKAHQPKRLHTRFNTAVLCNSPLFCFPHFEEMANFLTGWFNTRNSRKAAAITTTQQATFDAQEQFCKGLFVLLQETARAAPLSAKPVRHIYGWYLQRDAIINQSRAVERTTRDDGFFVIEMANGEMLKISKRLIDSTTLFDREMFDFERVREKLKEIIPDPIPTEEEAVEEPEITHRPFLITETFAGRVTKRPPPVPRPATRSFDYERFHAEMAAARRDEQETAMIAKDAGMRRLGQIAVRVGWE